jgi:hypothetical protein
LGISEQVLKLEPGYVVTFQEQTSAPSAIRPLFQVLIGECARISGQLRTVTESAVTLSVPWQPSMISIARPGVQGVLQRPGEAKVFAEAFDRVDPARWTVTGKPEVVTEPREKEVGRYLRLPAGGASIARRLDEPLVAGRIDLSFLDDGKVVSDGIWALEATFRGPTGPAKVRVLLGWAEDNLAVESPDGPTLAVQRLVRTPGWRDLTFRFGPEQVEIAVNGKELAHGKGPAGPLESLRIATESTGSAGPAKDLAGLIREIRLIRFAEPPASLEIDITQDEARLVVGDQLYGQIKAADSEHISMIVDDKPVTLDWSEVAGLHFLRAPAPGVATQGLQVRAYWRTASGGQPRDLDFAEGVINAVSDAAVVLATPYAGTLLIPRDQLSKIRVLDRGWQLVFDPASHHLGDNIRTTPPLLDPPLPEGGVLERTFDLSTISPEPAYLVLDVLDVVGETAGTPYSNLILKGELRTYVALNGKRIDYLNRHITTSNETPERIRIPIPKDLLKVGKNVLRIEQTGIQNDPTWFDDLGILRIAVLFARAETTRSPRPTGLVPNP